MIKDYPFVQPVISAIREEALEAMQQEQEVLVMAHLQIAHVYVARAARRGLSCTTVYLPYNVQKLVTERLCKAGFVLEKFSEHVPNRFIIRWD